MTDERAEKPVASPTWERRELPLLLATARAEGTRADARTESLADATGLSAQDASLGLRALFDADYLTGDNASSNDGPSFDLLDVRLLEKGRRAVGQWPADASAILFGILAERIVEATDPVEKSRLEQLRAAALGVSREVLVSVLRALARQAAGLP
jgi:hypothetical protein